MEATMGLMRRMSPKHSETAVSALLTLLPHHSFDPLSQVDQPLQVLHLFRASKFDFVVQNDDEEVMIQTKIVTTKITGTVLDEQPVAIYTIDKVLKPRELFKAEASMPASAPEPEKVVDEPRTSRWHKATFSPALDSPADSPDDEHPADQTANDNNGVYRFYVGRFGFVVVLVCVGLLLQ